MSKFELLKPRNFEEYLEYIFMEDVPEEAGDKETFDDNFCNWFMELDRNRMVALADKYAAKTF